MEKMEKMENSQENAQEAQRDFLEALPPVVPLADLAKKLRATPRTLRRRLAKWGIPVIEINYGMIRQEDVLRIYAGEMPAYEDEDEGGEEEEAVGGKNNYP